MPYLSGISGAETVIVVFQEKVLCFRVKVHRLSNTRHNLSVSSAHGLANEVGERERGKQQLD